MAQKIYYKLIPIFLLFWFLTLQAYSLKTSTWVRAYSTANSQAIIQTSDGGFLVASKRSAPQPGIIDFALTKLDLWGNVKWSRSYSMKTDWIIVIPHINSIFETQSGNYFIGGYVELGFNIYGTIFIRDAFSFLFKLDSSGNKIFAKKYKIDDLTCLASTSETSEGEFIMAGWTNHIRSDNTLDPSRGALIKLDSNGNVLWEKSIANFSCRLYITTKLEGNKFIIGGNTENNFIPIKPIILKIDSNGNFLWGKTFNEGKINSITTINDEKLIVCGSNLISVISGGGDIILSRSLSKSNVNILSTLSLKNNELLFMGYTYLQSEPERFFILKTEGELEFIWAKKCTRYEESDNEKEILNSISPTKDGGFIGAGYITSDTPEMRECSLVVKFDPDGNISNCDTFISDYEINLTQVDLNGTSQNLEINESPVNISNISTTQDFPLITIFNICSDNVFDIDKNGMISVVDLLKLLNYIVGNTSQDVLYDLNGDGAIDLKDAILLYKYLTSN